MRRIDTGNICKGLVIGLAITGLSAFSWWAGFEMGAQTVSTARCWSAETAKTAWECEGDEDECKQGFGGASPPVRRTRPEPKTLRKLVSKEAIPI